jgi:hypothetical protein
MIHETPIPHTSYQQKESSGSHTAQPKPTGSVSLVMTQHFVYFIPRHLWGWPLIAIHYLS